MRKQMPKTRKKWSVRFADGHFVNGEHTGRATPVQYCQTLKRTYEKKHPVSPIDEITVEVICEVE